MIHHLIRYRAVVHYEHFFRSLRGVAKIYGVSKSSLQRWVRETPGCKRKPRRRKSLLKEVEACIDNSLAVNPCLTLEQLCSIVARECKVSRSSVNTMARWMTQLHYSRKKVYKGVHYEPSVEIVQNFCNKYKELKDDEIVCIDEAGFHVGDHGRYGYAKCGKRIYKHASRTLRKSKFTLIMAISSKGVVDYKIIPNSCKKPDFIEFINELPTEKVNGKTIVMDNISFHHSSEVVDAAKKKGCTLLHIPPYSPRYNAIEYAFSTIKRRYRSICSDANILVADNDDYHSAIVVSVEMADSFGSLFRKVKNSVLAWVIGTKFRRYDD